MSDKMTMAYQEVKFGDICCEVKLTTKDPIVDGYDKYIGLEHLDSGSLKIRRWGLIEEDNPSFTRVFKKGHILIGKRRPYLKKAAIAEFDGICSGDIIVIESKKNDKILNDLLPFLIQSETFWDHAIQTSAGSLSPRTKFKSLEDLKISIPERLENQKSLLTLYMKFEEVIENVRSSIVEWEIMINTFRYEKILNKYDPTIKTENTIKFEQVVKINPKYKLENGLIKFCDMAALSTSDYKVEGEIILRDSKTSGARFKNDDVLLARITPCAENGKMCIVDFLDTGEIGKGSTEFIVASPIKISSLTLFNYLKSKKVSEYLIGNMEGSTGRQRIPANTLKDLYFDKQTIKENEYLTKFLENAYRIRKTLEQKMVNIQKIKSNIMNVEI